LNLGPQSSLELEQPFRSGLSTTKADRPVFIDLGGRVDRPHVVRDGFEVPAIEFVPAELSKAIANGLVLKTRVVSQNIKPGTKVPRGTAVDLTFTSPFVLPGEVVAGGHKGFAKHNIGQINEHLLSDGKLRHLVAARTDASQLGEDEQELVRKALKKFQEVHDADFKIDETDSDLDLKAAFITLRATLAFAGGER
jgi:hypothetical protein